MIRPSFSTSPTKPFSSATSTTSSPTGTRARSGSTAGPRTRPSGASPTNCSRLFIPGPTPSSAPSCSTRAPGRENSSTPPAGARSSPWPAVGRSSATRRASPFPSSRSTTTSPRANAPRKRCAPAKKRFRLIVDAVEDYAIFMLNPSGCVESWNAGAERIKGYRTEEIVGRHFSRFYTPEDIHAGRPQLALRIAREEGHYSEEGWRVRKDGTRFLAEVSIRAIHDDTGELRGFAKVTRDITSRKNAEEELPPEPRAPQHHRRQFIRRHHRLRVGPRRLRKTAGLSLCPDQPGGGKAHGPDRLHPPGRTDARAIAEPRRGRLLREIRPHRRGKYPARFRGALHAYRPAALVPRRRREARRWPRHQPTPILPRARFTRRNSRTPRSTPRWPTAPRATSSRT